MNRDPEAKAPSSSDRTTTQGESQWEALAPSPRAGLVGRYRLIDLLGRGGQGSVYLAEDTRLGRRVALKLLSGGAGARSRQALERFRREAEATARLDHPGIAVIYEAQEVDGNSYIAMCHVEGESLADQLAAQRSSASGTAGAPPATTSLAGVHAVLLLVEKLARALHAAHEAGIVHRDIKPGNVMITPEGQPVILDFGLARLEEDDRDLTVSGTILGTPAYMSPEQILGSRGRIDRRADVYSLGVTLYECLTLRRPFQASSREELYRVIMRDVAPDARRLNRWIPRDLQVVVETALEKDRDARYQSALDLAEDLRRVRQHEPIEAQPASLWRRTAGWVRRRPAQAALLVLGGLLFAVASGSAIALAILRGQAEAAGREATASLIAFERLADTERLERLRERSDALWPATPERVADLRALLADVESLVEGLPAHREALAALRAGGIGGDPAGRGSGLTAEDEFVRDQLVALVPALEALTVPEPDAAPESLAGLRARVEAARTIAGRSVECPTAQQAWTTCIEDVATHPAYGGLRLTPQLGLLPVGRDPDSQLWEFVHLPTGTAPTRDSSGHIEVTAEMGLVMVLIPAGTLGPGLPGEPLSPAGLEEEEEEGGEGTAARLATALPAFFLSKFEMTQAQWARFTRRNPSEFQPSSPWVTSMLHPVEHVSWADCDRVCRWLGLRLPGEAEWEYACRAGTTTVFSTGGRGSLQGVANIADLDLADEGVGARGARWRDGFVVHAPVGSYPGNRWGLHDVHGNVSEWCADALPIVESLSAPPPGESREPALFQMWRRSETRVSRGGHWRSHVRECRSSARSFASPDKAVSTIGCRPARSVED